jgi:ubiquinone/menaquinone biosynthesis C-methylase UbiE
MKNISYERYVETFRIIEKYSEEYGYQLKHLLKEAQGLKDEFSMLDIGAGTGQFAKSFMEKSKKKVRSYTAIEPSDNHTEALNRNLASLQIDKKVIKAKFTPQTLFENKFDLIVMSHSVYWFAADIAGHLENALRFLNKKGKMIIYLQTFATFACILNTFLRSSDPIYPHKISSRDITRILENCKIPYSISYLPGTLKADAILLAKNKKLLHNLISFCLFAEAKDLSSRDLKFAEDLVTLLSYKAKDGIKLNLSVAAITIVGDYSRFNEPRHCRGELPRNTYIRKNYHR